MRYRGERVKAAFPRYIWMIIIDDMRRHQADCPTAKDLEEDIEKALNGKEYGYREKIELTAEGNDLANLQKVIRRIVLELGPLAKDWGLIKEFALHEAG